MVPPGYPFFLAAIYSLVGHSQFPGKLPNVALGVGITLSTMLLARSFIGPLEALISGLLVALWPNLIFHSNILSSDLLATFGFAATLWLATRNPNSVPGRALNLVTLGVLVAWMTLVRPISLILVPAVGLYWWLSSRSLLRAITQLAPCVALVALTIAVWSMRNYVTFGEAIPIATNGGYNFWQTNHRYAHGNDTFWDHVPMHEAEYQTMRYADEFTRNREGYRYGSAYLQAHPAY